MVMGGGSAALLADLVANGHVLALMFCCGLANGGGECSRGLVSKGGGGRGFAEVASVGTSADLPGRELVSVAPE